MIPITAPNTDMNNPQQAQEDGATAIALAKAGC